MMSHSPNVRIDGHGGSKLGGVVDCHRVRRRYSRYVFIVILINTHCL